MRTEAKVTLAIFVVLGGMITWYVWPRGHAVGDLTIGPSGAASDKPVSRPDGDGSPQSRPTSAPLGVESARDVEDGDSALLTDSNRGGDPLLPRMGKRGRRRGDDPLARSAGDGGDRLQSVLAALESAPAPDENEDPPPQPTSDGSAASDPLDAGVAASESADRGRSRSGLIDRTPRSTHPPATGDRVYTVARGDTLAILAEVYYGSQAYAPELARANPQIENPNTLVVGTKLHLPPLPAPRSDRSQANRRAGDPGGAAESAAPEAGVYVVKDGDSLYRIAERLLGNASRWPEIYAENRSVIGSDPTSLKIGQHLQMPNDRAAE